MKKDKEKKKKRVKREQQSAPVSEKAETGGAEAVKLQDGPTVPAQPSAETDIPGDPAEDPLHRALVLVGGKWKLRILWALRAGGGLRYGEIKQQTDGITDMMLSQSLRELTEDGLANRKQFQQIPPKVEYQITPAGAELLPAIELLRAWASKQ